MKRIFPFEYPFYANYRYAINRTLFLYRQFRFGILKSYAVYVRNWHETSQSRL